MVHAQWNGKQNSRGKGYKNLKNSQQIIVLLYFQPERSTVARTKGEGKEAQSWDDPGARWRDKHNTKLLNRLKDENILTKHFGFKGCRGISKKFYLWA